MKPANSIKRSHALIPAHMLALFAGSALMLSTSVAFAGPFINGSFEFPVLPPSSFLNFSAGSTNLPGWTIGGTGGPVALANGGSTTNGVNDLSFNSGDTPAGTWIAQTFDTAIGGQYDVAFYVRSTSGGGVSLKASAKSQTASLLGETNAVPPGPIYVPIHLLFTATTETTTLEFLDTSGSTVGVDIRLDNISITSSFPAIVIQPPNQTIFSGSNASFSVFASGQLPLFYQWFFNTTNLLIGQTNSSLILSNVTWDQTGSYFVQGSNNIVTITSSNAILIVIDSTDTDHDSIPNYWEQLYGLNLNDPTTATNYPPGDKLTYLEKYLYGLNPLTNDTDGDGLTDYDEIFIYHTNPLLASTASDGIPDGWKVQYGLNPLIPIANSEAGFDGVTYMQVYQYDLTHTNLLNPNTAFAVGQGLSNYEIINGGQHTNQFYYDHEDRLQGMESSRGISIGYKYDGNGNLVRQSVLSRSAETNGLPVLWVWLNGLTNQPGIAYANSSGNGWNNYQEWLAGLSPNSNSVPSLAVNPGTNIASLTFPFTPTNIVIAAGNLNGMPGDEIVVGADGNATGKTNVLFILTQGASSWQVQQLPVGALGITSIAVGQPTNRPSPAIYIGLRQTGGTGAIWELVQTNGLWQTNVLAVSTNSTAYVLGVRSTDVLGSFATNGLDGGLFSLTYASGVWNQTVISTNSSHRGLGTHGAVFARTFRDSSVRLLDAGGIETFAGIPDFYKDNIQLPSSTLYNPTTGKYHFLTPSPRSWSAAESYFASYHGKLTLPADANENAWIASHYTESFCWIGLYWAHCDANGLGCGNFYPHYADGSFAPGGINTYSGYANWNPYDGSGRLDLLQSPSGLINYLGSGLWGDGSNGDSRDGIGEVLSPVVTFTNQWLIPEPAATSRFLSRGLSLATGLPRPNQTNSTSVFYGFADDQNQSGKLDAGDDFTLAEFVVSGNTWTTNTLVQVPITSANAAQSFSLAAVNFTGTGKDTLFTGEPDGRVYSWTGNDATNPLQRQLFSDAYVGKSWQAMCGVQMPAFGKGLAGLMVDPTNQSVCNVIFWSPQAVLPTPQPNLVETAPFAAVIPSANTLGSNAVVSIRLWDNEGNASTPFLQYQILGTTNWQNATLTALDGAAYSVAARVTALPGGFNHTLRWNALADVGANVVTNILLRASAQDFMLTGSWSQPTPFQLNTTIATNPTNPPVNFTVITPVQGGIQFNWQGGSNAWLYLQRSPTLAGTNAVWVNIWTGAPPTPISGSYTDFFGTNPMEFYRLKVVNP
jgi:YD repeat-containing protein